MKKASYIAIISLLWVGCQIKKQIPPDIKIEATQFMHLVYLDVKDDLTVHEKSEFENMIRRLEQIPEVLSFQIGVFKDVGDPRALSQYEYVLNLLFENKAAYDIYQSSDIHVNVKKALSNFLSGPPATYDFHPIKSLPYE